MTSVKKSLRKGKLDIFTQDITPIENYKIRGDTNPEHEIKNIYLLKMSARYTNSIQEQWTEWWILFILCLGKNMKVMLH